MSTSRRLLLVLLPLLWLLPAGVTAPAEAAAGATTPAGAAHAARAAGSTWAWAPSTVWRWPLAGSPEVVRAFDPPTTRYGRGHRGVDLAGMRGAVVLAAGDGTVGYAGVLAGRGVVSVPHAGGLRTTYEPVIATVRPGDRVAAGAPLGRLVGGHPGCTRAACLHWGLLRGDTYLDPLSLLGRGPIRLLPRAEAPAVPQTAGPAASTSLAGGLAAAPPDRHDGAHSAHVPAGASPPTDGTVPLAGRPVGTVAPSTGAGVPPVPPAATAAAVGLAVAGVVLLARRRPP
jgi:Peptidase family M23